MAKIILKFEAAVIKEYLITGSEFRIGREPDNDIVIDHPAVSRHHCRILLQGDTFFVEDLNSTNGTLVNGKKIIKAGIHNQDIVAIAKHTLVLVDDRPAAAPVPAPPAPPAPAAAPAPEPAAPQSPEEAALAKMRAMQQLGGLRVTEGGVDAQTDFALTENSTYLGKADRATIKVKGGMLAPDLAAMVSRRPTGYVLVAIKDGYPKVNGMAVQGERPLNEGDVIEVGGTILQFYLKNS